MSQKIVVQSLSRVQLFATPWTAACQASLSVTISRSLRKLMSIESITLSNHLILCCPLLLPSVTKYWFPFDSPYPLQPCETIEVTLSPPVTHQLAMGLGLWPLTRGRVDGGITERRWRAAGGDLTWIIKMERLSQPCLGVPAARAPLGQPAPLPPGPTPAPTGQPAPTLPLPSHRPRLCFLCPETTLCLSP